MATILQMALANPPFWMKIALSLLKLDWFFFSLRSSWQYAIIISNNGMAPNRGQAIIWTNDGQFTDALMYHSVSMI